MHRTSAWGRPSICFGTEDVAFHTIISHEMALLQTGSLVSQPIIDQPDEYSAPTTQILQGTPTVSCFSPEVIYQQPLCTLITTTSPPVQVQGYDKYEVHELLDSKWLPLILDGLEGLWISRAILATSFPSLCP